MSKDDFIARHVNELTGFLIEAFHVVVEEDRRKEKADAFSAARKGQFIIEQIARARAFLAKMYDDLPAQDAVKNAAEVEAAVADMKVKWAQPLTLDKIHEALVKLPEADRTKHRKWMDERPKGANK